MSGGRSKHIARAARQSASRAELLGSLIQQRRLSGVIPLGLEILEGDDPLASAGQFRSDLLRGLMEVPGHFWGRHPPLYERYRSACAPGRQRAANSRRRSACTSGGRWRGRGHA
jgi:hypothetical protein